MSSTLTILKKLGALLALLALVIVAYLVWARPYQLHWGATAAEISRPMPGDELDPTPTFLATRAITIKGTPAQIWPWLIQMGYNRAGFYAYDINKEQETKWFTNDQTIALADDNFYTALPH